MEPERHQMTIWRMRAGCWISLQARKHKSTTSRARARTQTHALLHVRNNTQKYVTLVTFPLLQRFRYVTRTLPFFSLCQPNHPFTLNLQLLNKIQNKVCIYFSQFRTKRNNVAKYWRSYVQYESFCN